MQCLAPLFDFALTLTSCRLFRHRDALVNDCEIAIIMQHTLVITVFGEYIDPKIDIRLQLRGLGKHLIGERKPAKGEN